MTVPGTATAIAHTETPYDTVIPYVSGKLPGYVGGAVDKLRLAAYSLYDNLYRNVEGAFALVMRGSENRPVYVPNGRTIVETCQRFLAVGFDYTATGPGADEFRLAFDTLLRRQKFWSKFTTQKRYGLVRGDAIWHIVGDFDKTDVNQRLNIYELDPSTYFPIVDANDATVVTGCHIITRLQDPTQPNTTIVRRQTYSINDNGTVQSIMDYYPVDKWDDRTDPATLKPYQQDVRSLPKSSLRQPIPFSITLDSRITRIPIYHIKNTRAPLDVFGVSELSGIERLIAGVNQGISDQELALALEGLGLYFTTSGPPTDDAGNPMNWVLGPGRVVEGDLNTDFKRVTGVSSVEPSIRHLDWLTKAMRQGTGSADVAVGMVDNTTPLSGIALAFQMGPLLAKNKEKETEMMDVYDDLFNDLTHVWMPVMGILSPADALDVVPVVGDPMPTDRLAVIDEVVALLVNAVITIPEAQDILKKRLGYEFTQSSVAQLANEKSTMSTAADPFGARLASLTAPTAGGKQGAGAAAAASGAVDPNAQ